MHSDGSHPILRLVRQIAAAEEIRLEPDEELLRRYARQGNHQAFEILVHRHGAMVWRVCCNVLGASQAAEDAFQATFLILIRKANSIGQPEKLANWLYGVAHRVAVRARQTIARRAACETKGVEAVLSAADDGGDQLQLLLLQEELQRLPAKYRSAMVLCYLEGHTHEEAARQLQWPLGTLKVRLMRGREMLRRRLVRRGVALGVAALLEMAAPELPAAVLDIAIKAGWPGAAGAGLASAPALDLAEGALNIMWWNNLKRVAMTLSLLALVAVGAGWYGLYAASSHEEAPPGPNVAPEEAAVAPEHADAKKRPDAGSDVLWGEQVDGLQAGITFLPAQQRSYQVGDTVTLVVKVRNVGGAPRTVKWRTPFARSEPGIESPKGNRVQVFPAREFAKGKPIEAGPAGLGWAIAERRLSGGEEIELGRVLVTLTSVAAELPSVRDDSHVVVTQAPGAYKLVFSNVAWQRDIPENVSACLFLSTPHIDMEVHDKARAAIEKSGGKVHVFPPAGRGPASYRVTFPATCTIRDDDLVHLRALNYPLKQLVILNQVELTDAGLAHLQYRDDPYLVYISRCPKITDRGLEHFHNWRWLAHLDVYETSATDAGLARLRRALPHPKINSLSLKDLESMLGGPPKKGTAPVDDIEPLLGDPLLDGLERLSPPNIAPAGARAPEPSETSRRSGSRVAGGYLEACG